MRIKFGKEVGHKLGMDELLRLLDKAFREVEGLARGAGSANVTLVVSGGSGGSGGSSGGGSSAFDGIRQGTQSVSAGTNPISFSSNLDTASYQVYAWLKDGDSSFQPVNTVDAVSGKSISGFSITVWAAGTLVWLVIED